MKKNRWYCPWDFLFYFRPVDLPGS